jgi:hypothetical protein
VTDRPDTPDASDADWAAERFEQERRRLVGVAYRTTVVARISLNMLHARRTRREDPPGRGDRPGPDGRGTGHPSRA